MTAYEVRNSDWSSDVCSSDLVRGVGRAMDRPPGNIAMKQMFRLMPTQTEALRGAVELYLFDDGYAGLQLVEDDIANLCLVIEQKAFQSLGGGWDALLDALRNDKIGRASCRARVCQYV